MKHQYLFACVLPFLFPVSIAADVQNFLEKGNEFLLTGQFNSALINFDAAILEDPDNYLTYYKRATAYLSLGRNQAAVTDFTKILTLKPDFDKALMQRARLYTKEGEFKLAKSDIQIYLKNRPSDQDATQLLESIERAKTATDRAEAALTAGQYDDCLQEASNAIVIAPRLARLRVIAAECHMAKGDMEGAVEDLTRASQLMPSNPDLLIKLANINFFSLYEPQGALSHAKQCLHYDPEQKQCKQLFRLLKKLDKEIKGIQHDLEAKKYATATNKLIGTATKKGFLANIDEKFEELHKSLTSNDIPKRLHLACYELACKIYGQQKTKEEAKIDKWCSATLELQEDNVEALTYRGELRLQAHEYEAAVKDFERADEASDGQNSRVRQLLQRAQKMLRQSKRRDYYKILDVDRDADARTIKKAYRQKAHEWHPDKYSGDLTKEQVEKKMADINQAYEVLSDDDKRRQFDNGFDPYEPENGQNGGPGGHPFHGQNPFAHFQGGFPFNDGGFPGGGQPFTFKMQF